MKRIVFLTGCCLFFIAAACSAQEITYQHSASIEQITFSWTVEGELLHIKLSAKTTGWVGVGFNPAKGMKNANFILGYVKDGKVKLRDDYGTSERKHSKDTKEGGQENFTNAGGKEVNGTTEITFTIPLNSGDSKDSVLIPDGDTTVLLAYGAGRDSFISKHQYHGVLKVNLSTGEYQEAKHH